MKYLLTILAAGLLVGSARGAQDTTLTKAELADQRVFEAWLETNATDAETRLAAIEGGTATVTLATDKVLVGNNSSNQAAMGVTGDVSLSQDGTNATLNVDSVQDDSITKGALTAGDFGDFTAGADGTCTLDDDVVAAAEMADADHGDIAWSSGVATIDAGVVTEAKLSTAAQDKIAYITVVGADLASAGTGTITIQLKDAAGNDLAAAAIVRTWIGTADDYGPDALTDYSVSTGTSKGEVTANAEYLAITDGSGTIVMAVDNGGAGTVYAWAEVGGRIVASGAVELTAP